jgi:hypothetical protein
MFTVTDQRFILILFISKDLRWNNIGLVGGKGLIAALKKNHTLIQLHVAGNNIPEEIDDAISKLISFYVLKHLIKMVKCVKRLDSIRMYIIFVFLFYFKVLKLHTIASK